MISQAELQAITRALPDRLHGEAVHPTPGQEHSWGTAVYIKDSDSLPSKDFSHVYIPVCSTFIPGLFQMSSPGTSAEVSLLEWRGNFEGIFVHYDSICSEPTSLASGPSQSP